MGVIRLLLAISVVIAHTDRIFGITFVGGQIAVQAFYIISGFYMSLVLNEKYIFKNGSYKLFLSNRLLRLFPIYWVILLLSIGLSIITGIVTHGEYWLKLQPYVDQYQYLNISNFLYLIFSNFFLIGQDWFMFMGLNTTNGHFFFTSNFWNTDPKLYTFLIISQAWTISVEITFYIIAPLLVRRNIFFTFSIIFLSLLIRLVLISKGLEKDPWNYRFFPNELFFFMLGNLSYKILKKIEYAPINGNYISVFIVFLITFTLFYDKIDFPYKMQTYFFIFFVTIPFIFQWTKNSKIDQWIGDLSYPVYLSHMLFVLIINKLQPLVNVLGTGLTVILLAIGLSILLNKYISKPLERIRQKRIFVNTSPV